MEHVINTIEVPEGMIDFVTVVVSDHTNEHAAYRAGNVVVGATFIPDWSEPSPELEAFDSTALAWCSSIEDMPHELSEYGYVLVEEKDDLLTNQIRITS